MVEEGLFDKYKRNLRIGKTGGDSRGEGLEEIDPGDLEIGSQ